MSSVYYTKLLYLFSSVVATANSHPSSYFLRRVVFIHTQYVNIFFNSIYVAYIPRGFLYFLAALILPLIF